VAGPVIQAKGVCKSLEKETPILQHLEKEFKTQVGLPLL
jgi:hypothetical protein